MLAVSLSTQPASSSRYTPVSRISISCSYYDT